MPGHDIKWIIRRIVMLTTLVAVVVGSIISYAELQASAKRLAEQHARSLLEAVNSQAEYTRTQVAPLIEALPSNVFHPETQPSFAAQMVFRTVNGHGTGFDYRSPALNPMAPSDRATPFEVELIGEFAEHAELAELTGVADTPHERLYYLARPIRLTDEACLRCHGSPDQAPPAMLARYGTASGFGWKMGETVGLQLITLPVTTQFNQILRLIVITAGCIVVMFGICYLGLTVSLGTVVVRPLQHLVQAAEAASVTANSSVRMPTSAVDELRRLAEAIERLRVSLVKTMRRVADADLRQAAAREQPTDKEAQP